jgi:hypothetical protein
MHGCFENFANCLKTKNFHHSVEGGHLPGDRMVRRLPTNWRFHSSQSRGKGEGDARITERGREDGGGEDGGGGKGRERGRPGVETETTV